MCACASPFFSRRGWLRISTSPSLSSEVSESAVYNFKAQAQPVSIGAVRKKGVQYFLRGTVCGMGEQIILLTISCTGVPKRGDVRI